MTLNYGLKVALMDNDYILNKAIMEMAEAMTAVIDKHIIDLANELEKKDISLDEFKNDFEKWTERAIDG